MTVTEREKLYDRAFAYISYAAKAGDWCRSAAKNVYSVQSSVGSNWQGDSGNAMANALYDQYLALQQAGAALETAAAQMLKELTALYNSLQITE